MELENYVFLIGAACFIIALGLYLGSRLEDRINERIFGVHGNVQSLSANFINLRTATNDELTRALTKSETAFQIAHQAQVTAKQAFDNGGTVYKVEIAPLKFRKTKTSGTRKSKAPTSERPPSVARKSGHKFGARTVRGNA